MPRFARAFYVHDSQTRVQTTSAHYLFEWGNLPAQNQSCPYPSIRSEILSLLIYSSLDSFNAQAKIFGITPAVGFYPIEFDSLAWSK